MKPAGGTLVIRNAADLQLLLPGRTQWRAIELYSPELPPDEQASWQDRLARDYGACGCETGRYFMAASLLGIALLMWQTWGLVDWSWLDRGLWAFGILFAAAFVGKLAGLLVARLRLRRTVAALSARFV
jgi:hypothetical protein